MVWAGGVLHGGVCVCVCVCVEIARWGSDNPHGRQRRLCWEARGWQGPGTQKARSVWSIFENALTDGYSALRAGAPRQVGSKKSGNQDGGWV